ncbi:MAG: serine/threonine protein kinase [Bacteroidota bacterium]
MSVDCPTIVVPEFFNTVTAALSQKYELVAEIGQGGHATVYQAIQKNLDRKVALKVLLPHLVNDQDYIERFHLEARAIARLRHPHIVTIYDEGSESGVHYMAMEYLDGTDLHHLIKEHGRLSVSEAIGMARCIAGALDYAHRYGIVHRDVKSSNIIMAKARSAVLTDFGIAQANYASLHTKVGSVLGTPEFMSPEQAGGKAVDSRSDIYSLGVVLYHALSGRYPYHASTPIGTIHKILFEDPVPIGKLVKLPAAVEHAIDRCLEKDPAKRVSDGKELIELLNVAASHKDLAHRRAPRHIASGVRRAIMRGAFALTAICVLAAGYLAWQRSAVAEPPAQTVVEVQNREPRFIQIPNVVGLTKDDAISVLRKGGFQVGEMRSVAVPDPAAKERVNLQRPAQGTQARPGSVVILFIAE